MSAGRLTLFFSVCALVVLGYAGLSQPAVEERGTPAGEQPYNRLVEGFRSGQLGLKQATPAGLLALSDPYDSSANARFRAPPYNLEDLSYYRGRLFVYFGAPPAVLLFWPYRALTGSYLSERAATVVFCSLGFLAGAALWLALLKRYFAGAGGVPVSAGIIGLAFATGIPDMLQSPTFHEVAVAGGYAFTFLALGALWLALHRPEARARWTAWASFAFGLAVATRPSLVVGSAVLLIPLLFEWRTGPSPRRAGRRVALLAAALVPITLLGLGVMRYNALRFQNPFEFGDRYILAGDPRRSAPSFSWHYAWFNLRMYFLAPARWSRHFPFVHAPIPALIPAGHRAWRNSFGILANLPLVWLSLAFPAVFWDRRVDAGSRFFGAALAVAFAAPALLLTCYGWTFERYEVDFLPALVLIALWGGLRLAAGPPPRRMFLWLLLGCTLYSAGFGLLLSCSGRALQWATYGVRLTGANRLDEALLWEKKATRLDPDLIEAHSATGLIFERMGRENDALAECREAVRLAPDSAAAQLDWGTVLSQSGHFPEAIIHFRVALRLDPGLSIAHNNLGIALARTGHFAEASEEFEECRVTGLDSATLETNLGNTLYLTGHIPEAMAHYRAALALAPDFIGARQNLELARRALAHPPLPAH